MGMHTYAHSWGERERERERESFPVATMTKDITFASTTALNFKKQIANLIDSQTVGCLTCTRR